MARKKTVKPSIIEKQKRILLVADKLCDGLGIREIAKDQRVIQWNVERECLYQYIKTAWKDIGSFQSGELEDKIVKAIAERDRLKVRSVAKGDLRTALAAMDSRDKIEGILDENGQKKGSLQNPFVVSIIEDERKKDGTGGS